MKKVLYLATLSLLVYHIPAYSINFKFWQKNDIEKIKKDIPVQKNTQITLFNTQGSYTIKPWNQQKIALEVEKTGSLDQLKATLIKSKVSGKEASITTQLKEGESSAKVTYTLRVPEDASIKITQTRGPVTINGINGDIDVSVEYGSIDIKGSTKTVIAKTGSGKITLKQRKLVEPNSIFLQVHKGSIELYLPRETRASLHANVGRGTISSEHPVSMTLTTKLDRYWVDRIKKDISGVLGNFRDHDELEKFRASAPITLEVTKGNITIKES